MLCHIQESGRKIFLNNSDEISVGHPVLADSFFTKHRPDPGFFSKWKAAGPWNEHFFPIYEWQGILYVGISNFAPEKTEENWCFVQANPDLMQKLWADLNSPVQNSVSPSPTADFNSFDLLSDSDSEESSEESLENSEPAEEFEALGGLDLSAGAPVDLSANFSSEMNAPTLISSDLPPPPPPEFAEAPRSSVPIPGLENENFHWTTLWDSISSEFEHGMIFLVQQGNMIPWKWDPDFKSVNSQQTYSLQKPSPFRIVENTQKPYHGYLVKNDVSSMLFKDWNNGFYPDHLTVCPISVHNAVMGFFVAWGKKPEDTKRSLQTVEASAQQIGDLLAQSPNLLKAA